MRRILLDDNLWYSSELADIVKKGSTSTLAQAMVDDLLVLLTSEEVLTWNHLREATVLLAEVKGLCRSQVIASALDTFADSCLCTS